ncbi:unnamed protein product [Prunus armeniaca]
MGIEDPFFFFLVEHDGFPPNPQCFMMPVDLYAEDLRVLLSKSGTSTDGADHISLSIYVQNWCLRLSGHVLVQFSLPNQGLDDFPQAYAFFGIMAVVLMVSVELPSIPIVLSIGFPVNQFGYYILLVH